MPDLHVRRGDKVLGPFPPGKIKRMITEGKIKPDDLIRVEGEDQWNTIVDIPNLTKLFGSDTPPVTTRRQKGPEPGSASSGPQKMFVKRGDAVHGPLTLKAVQDGIAAGKIDRSDQIGSRNTGPWKEAGSLPKLFPTDEVVSDEFEGFETDDVEIQDEWDQLADDEQSSETFGILPKTVEHSSKHKKPSKRKKQSSRGMLLGMSFYFLGATALVLVLFAVVYVQFFSLESRADRLAERMIALSVQSEAMITSIGQSKDMETIRARGARAEAKNLELDRVATELAQLQTQMTPEQRARWEEKWTLKLLKLK